jgi:hypothetical protein
MIVINDIILYYFANSGINHGQLRIYFALFGVLWSVQRGHQPHSQMINDTYYVN